MALNGFLFDLDGTLVDSNALHAEAWARSLEQHGFRVGLDRIRQEIGKGGDQFVPSVLGAEADDKQGDALRAGQSKAFTSLVSERGIAAAPGAEALLRHLRERGLRTALATSSKPEHLEVVESACGVPWSKLVDVVAGAADVEQSKPHPDILQAALRKLDYGPAECAMLGDTPWDALSGREAGVVVVGVTFGGSEPQVLRGAGARVVYADPAHVLREIEDVLHAVSPTPLKLTASVLNELMAEALAAARGGLKHGEAPLGGVVVNGSGEILGRGWSGHRASRDPLLQPELVAIRDAGPRLLEAPREALLVSTLEPSPTATAAAVELGIDTIVYGLSAPRDRSTHRVTPAHGPELQLCRVVGGVRADESRELLRHYLASGDRSSVQDSLWGFLEEAVKAAEDPGTGR
jgi:HAD superfamily hydrolase (TIGR01509 family)